MSRTMSGIPTSGGGGDALLAGGTLLSPQTFTGFNEFDELTQFKTKRPELSDAGGATFPPTDDEFITKLDGVDLFGSLSGSAQLNGGGNTAEDPPQTFTGFNEFDEKVVIKGESLDFTNATRRVIDMTIAPLPSNSNKLLMEAPTTEITMTSGSSKNQLSQVASSSAINTFLQTGISTTTNLISQVGANSTITTDGKFTTATAPTAGTHLCNKTYVDSVSGTSMSVSQQDINTLFYSVVRGNPSASNPNGFGGLLNEVSPYGSGTGANLQVDVAIPLGTTNFAVAITSRVMGEWQSREFNKGLAIARATLQANGTFLYTAIFRGKLFASTNGLIIAPFTITLSNNVGSTVEAAYANHIDDTAIAGLTYRYTPLLINTDGQSNSQFGLNRYYNAGSSLDRECGTSTTTAQLIKTG